jgi:hypothetical protein
MCWVGAYFSFFEGNMTSDPLDHRIFVAVCALCDYIIFKNRELQKVCICIIDASTNDYLY